MKLSIRFADQIVGALIVLALGIVIFVIFMLGSNQRWFSRDYHFTTYFPSAAGLSQNMAVQYKGFTIGRVKSIQLAEDDQVEVRFTIFDTYIDRVRSGSVVEVVVSPIGGLGGNQFIFYPGRGAELLPEGETIPTVNSSAGKYLLASGLAQREDGDDSISQIINSVGVTITTLNTLLADVQEALAGTSTGSLGRTMGNVEAISADLRYMSGTFPDDISGALDRLMTQLEPLLVNFRELSNQLADPGGSAAALLDSQGDVYQNLSASLESVSGTLYNLEQMSEFLLTRLPQLAIIITELQSSLRPLEDVLVSLTNNPLLKRGVPERVEARAGGTHTRDMDF